MTPESMPRACVYCRMYEPNHLPTCIEVFPRLMCLRSGECVLPPGHAGDCDWGPDDDD